MLESAPLGSASTVVSRRTAWLECSASRIICLGSSSGQAVLLSERSGASTDILPQVFGMGNGGSVLRLGAVQWVAEPIVDPDVRDDDQELSTSEGVEQLGVGAVLACEAKPWAMER